MSDVEFKGFKYQQPKKEDINGVTVMTDRLKKLKDEWENAPSQVYVDDTLLFTESWKETEGLPKDYRWAKAFEKRLMNCPIIIREGEIVVGSTTKFVRGANTLCAAKPREILKFCESGQFDRKSSDVSSSAITDEDLAALKADAEYWIPKIPPKNFVMAQVEELMDEETLNCMMDRAGVFEGRAPRVNPDRGIFQNYGAFANGDGGPTVSIMSVGLNEVIRACEEELDRIDREGIGVHQGLSNQWGWRKFWFIKSMILTCITAAMAGYALAKKRFVGRKLLFTLIVCAMALPKQVILIPLLREMSALNLYNTIWAVIFPIVGWPFGVFLMKQFSEGIPTEMLEAARIDGASEARTFVKIVLPMVKPGIGALAIFTFINSWNDYFMQLIMLSSTSNLTISLGIAKLQAENSTDFGLIMAGAALAAVPIIIIFLIFQKYFTKGIAMGAVKG